MIPCYNRDKSINQENFNGFKICPYFFMPVISGHKKYHRKNEAEYIYINLCEFLKLKKIFPKNT